MMRGMRRLPPMVVLSGFKTVGATMVDIIHVEASVKEARTNLRFMQLRILILKKRSISQGVTCI